MLLSIFLSVEDEQAVLAVHVEVRVKIHVLCYVPTPVSGGSIPSVLAT